MDRIEAWRLNPEAGLDAMRKVVSAMFTEKSDPVLIERITSDMCSAPLDVNAGTIRGWLMYDFGEALDKTTVPVRCICSDRGPFNLEAARQHCHSFEVEFMSGVGHFVMLEDPATFNRLLEGIVQDLVSK